MTASRRAAEGELPNPRTLRDVTGHFATGVTVITTLGDRGAPVGMVVNSFTSLSLDPPLVMWGINRNAPSFGAFRSHAGFAVNIMGANAKDETLQFARPSANKFADIDWKEGLRGVPVLDLAVATIECRTLQQLPGGDHVIILGQVERCRASGGDPLLFHRGQFASIGEEL